MSGSGFVTRGWLASGPGSDGIHSQSSHMDVGRRWGPNKETLRPHPSILKARRAGGAISPLTHAVPMAAQESGGAIAPWPTPFLRPCLNIPINVGPVNG
jgi:hypothetical protein